MSKNRTEQVDRVRRTLILPAALNHQVAEMARAHGRSANAEIVWQLQQAVKRGEDS